MYIEAFTPHFGELSDTRQSAKVTYPLEDILFITLCGVVAGAEGWSDIRDYADGHICAMASPLMTLLPVPFRVSTQSSLELALSTGCRLYMKAPKDN